MSVDRIVVIAYAVDEAGWKALDTLTDNAREYIFTEGNEYELMVWHVESKAEGQTNEFP